MKRHEAIEIVREYYPSSGKDLNEALETLIPELKESEDEKTRKALLVFVKDAKQSLELQERVDNKWQIELFESYIAWLEKQGEHIKFLQSIQISDEVTRNPDGILVNLSQFKRKAEQGSQNLANSAKTCKDEQKPADKDELFDRRYAQHLVESQRQKSMIQWKGDNLKEVIDFTGKDRNFDKWFKSFEEYEQYVQKHNGIFKLFNADGSHYEIPVGAWIVKTPDGCNVASKAIFKQNPAWSEEDEDAMGMAIIALEDMYDEDAPNTTYGGYNLPFNKAAERLKTLKERYTWKPSDEQMDALDDVISSRDVKYNILSELWKDLKKLKG